PSVLCSLQHGRTRVHPSFPTRRSSDLVRRRACPGGLLVVRLRPLQAPAVLRRLAQGLGILAGQVHHRRSPEDELDRREFRALVRSEEHTSELQSLAYLVCRLLLEKKKS